MKYTYIEDQISSKTSVVPSKHKGHRTVPFLWMFSDLVTSEKAQWQSREMFHERERPVEKDASFSDDDSFLCAQLFLF